jgi:menaquinone-dependent protoporphyrinogen IX oxidase
VRIFHNDEWPSFGELQVVGGDGTKARLLVFDKNLCRIIVDTYGDDTYNYESDYMSWSDL